MLCLFFLIIPQASHFTLFLKYSLANLLTCDKLWFSEKCNVTVTKFLFRLFPQPLNCTKCVQNYSIFFFEIRRWWDYMPAATEIWISNTREGCVHKIQARLHTIVQNVYKIMVLFLFWNSKMVELRAFSVPILNCEYQGRGGCTKFELSCTKLYEMYTKLYHHFFSKFEDGEGRLHASTLPKF